MRKKSMITIRNSLFFWKESSSERLPNPEDDLLELASDIFPNHIRHVFSNKQLNAVSCCLKNQDFVSFRKIFSPPFQSLANREENASCWTSTVGFVAWEPKSVWGLRFFKWPFCFTFAVRAVWNWMHCGSADFWGSTLQINISFIQKRKKNLVQIRAMGLWGSSS